MRMSRHGSKAALCQRLPGLDHLDKLDLELGLSDMGFANAEDFSYALNTATTNKRIPHMAARVTECHNNLVIAIMVVLQEFGFTCKLEPRALDVNGSAKRPDLEIIVGLDRVYIDVRVTSLTKASTLSQIRIGQPSSVEKILQSDEKEKQKKHDYLKSIPGASFFPIVISTGGMFGEETVNFINHIIKYRIPNSYSDDATVHMCTLPFSA